MKVLIVDDEGIVLESCRKVLEAEGFDVIPVKSADEALLTIEKEHPGLLLIDLKMPVHDGIYLMKELKNRDIDTPAIVMSGYSTEETIKEADAMGACRFLPKPFTPDELVDTVRQVLKGDPMKQIKALVIDDEQIVLDSVKKILAEEHYETDVTLSGKEGIAMALKNPYDIVLTDIRMPEVDGLIVLRDIKRQKPALPVIIITGYGSIRSAVQAMKLGASEYIEKPFSPDDLIRSIKEAIDHAQIHEPEPQAVVHKEEVIRVLELAASDAQFWQELMEHGADALDHFDLSKPEKLAIITGDIHWIEDEIGPLAEHQRAWLEARLEAEVW